MKSTEYLLAPLPLVVVFPTWTISQDIYQELSNGLRDEESAEFAPLSVVPFLFRILAS